MSKQYTRTESEQCRIEHPQDPAAGMIQYAGLNPTVYALEAKKETGDLAGAE